MTVQTVFFASVRMTGSGLMIAIPQPRAAPCRLELFYPYFLNNRPPKKPATAAAIAMSTAINQLGIENGTGTGLGGTGGFGCGRGGSSISKIKTSSLILLQSCFVPGRKNLLLILPCIPQRTFQEFVKSVSLPISDITPEHQIRSYLRHRPTYRRSRR